MNNRLRNDGEAVMNDNNKNGREKKITISDIADALGLSKTTISRAISGKGRIGEETRQRVFEYIQKHDYKPNAIAKGLAQSKTFNMGVVLPADSNITDIPFFQGCLMGVCEAAAGHDYDVIVSTTTENDYSQLVRLIDDQKVDGIILTRTLQHDMALEYLKDVKIPFVVIGTTEEAGTIQIDSDHITGCAELTSILLMSGSRSVALLAGNQEHVVNRMRYAGFIKAFNDRGEKPDNSLIYLNLNSKGQIHRAVDAAMKRNVDCIICTDDNICSIILAKLNEESYCVPKDVKVASYYNSAYLENYNPPITAVNIDVKELGLMAGKKLIELIEGKEVIGKSTVDYELRLKKSTM